jgi:iron complex outermembrane receptor protein
VEIDLATKPLYGFQVLGGYSYNQTKYTKSNTYIVGSKMRYNPEHTANASVYYTFSERTLLKGFNAGFIAYYIGERVAGRSSTTANPGYKLMPLPDYLQLDASVGYTVQKITVRVKLSNLFNKLSYYVHDDNSINPIAPRQLAATVSFKL